MAGIYIHIPFCKSKCAYCNFFSLASESKINDYVEALKKAGRSDLIGTSTKCLIKPKANDRVNARNQMNKKYDKKRKNNIQKRKKK